MAHDLMFENGKASMMYVDAPPWHGLGTRLEKPATAEEAIQAANLDWMVTKRPLLIDTGKKPVRVPNRFAVVRQDHLLRGDCEPLGIVGKDYNLLQNREAFSFFDPIVGENAAVYHTAGALGNGERIWILAKLPGEIRVKGDDITDKYLLLSNSHDGSSAVQMKFTPIRVVCQNTLTMALSRGPTVRVQHGRGMLARLTQAHDLLNIVNNRFDAIGESFQQLAGVQIGCKTAEDYMAAVFPMPRKPARRDAEENYERRKRQIKRHRALSLRLFDHGKGNDLPSVKGSLWAAYNGVTEYVDHCMAVSKSAPDSDKKSRHLNAIWFGDGYLTKSRAYGEALKFGRN